MEDVDIDFTGTNSSNQTPPTDVTTDNNQVKSQPVDQVDKDDITGKDNSKETPVDQTKTDNTSTGELNVGDNIEVDGIVYRVDDNGNLVDNDGNVFKETKDVSDWLKSVDIEPDDESELTLSSIQEALGVIITDSNGNTVEFTNDAQGVKSYVDSVLALKSNELQTAAINRLYQDNPLLRQFQDYVELTGSPRGFGEIPDRSGIVLDKDNENQLVAVIKMAANEFGNKSLNDNYIKYLRDSGALYDEARTQLAALVDKDIAYKRDLEVKAQAKREQQQEDLKNYYSTIEQIINDRKIGNYKIPDSFTKEVNGQKIVITPNDFYNYVSVPVKDENGNICTKYQKDLENLSDTDYINRELLDAWLMFTGGTYKDLVDMAIKEEQVRQLRVKSKKSNSTKAIKIIKNSANKTSIDDIVL